MWWRKSCQSQVEYHAASRSSREPWKVTMPPLNSSLKYFTKLLCWVALIKQSASESSLFRRLAKSHHFIMLGAPCRLFWEIRLPGEWPVLPSLLDPDKCPPNEGETICTTLPVNWRLNKALLHPTVPICPYQVQQREGGSGVLPWEWESTLVKRENSHWTWFINRELGL